uniref:Uncharacterized protein n=1 Tax=Noctiluca scintillans TaxID=2966 RepID=A0A7S1AAX8_NOCSC
MDQHFLDVVVERERARRILDRFQHDDSDGGEISRELRAHQCSAAFRQAVIDGVLKDRSHNVEQLESALDLRRRRQLLGMLVEERGLSTSSPVTPPLGLSSETNSAASPSDPPTETAPKGRALPPSRSSSTAQLHEGKSPFDLLKETLDDISIKSILELHRSGDGVTEAEMVATAASCAIANIDETVQVSIHSLDPEFPWPQALDALAKPGHFVNSLRRFPYAADAGRVPEDNIVAARHFLGLADEESELHRSAQCLFRWVENAIAYWESHEGKTDEASQRGSECETRKAPSRGSRSELTKSANTESGRLFQPPPRVNSSRTVGRSPARAKSQRGSNSARSSITAPPKTTDPKPTAANRPSASPRQRERKPSTSNSGTSSTSALGSARAGMSKASPSSTQTQAAAMTPSRNSRPATSPQQRRNNAQTRPALSPPPRAFAHSGPNSVAAPPSRPNSSPQPQARAKARGPQHSQPTLTHTPTRSPSQSSSRAASERQADEPRQLQLNTSRSTGALSHVPRPGNSTPTSLLRAAPPTQPPVAEWRRMLEETKKEVREIRSIESQIRWNMHREEKKEKHAEEQADDSDLMDWRWKQSDEMKAAVAEKMQVEREVDLVNSKAFQEFKRERRALLREEELDHIQEAYLQDRENALWRAEYAKAVWSRDKEVIADRVQDVNDVKEIRNIQRLREKEDEENDRAMEQTLEMANLARELTREKERLLESLQFTRQAQRLPHANKPRSFAPRQ